MVRHKHWINGAPVPPSSGVYLPTFDPRTREPGARIAAGSETDVDVAVKAASRSQRAWADSSGLQRSAVLNAIAAAMEADSARLTALEEACTGKLEHQLRLELDMSVAYFRYYAGLITAMSGRTIDLGATTHAFTRLEPYGVIGAITPWNLPLNQASRGIAPALAAGNTVVAKPSEFTSTSTLRLAELATDSGLPDGVLNVVTGTGLDAGTPLAAHPDVKRIVFTGSLNTGRHLAAIAADRLIPMTLELGGKSPLVVFASADLDRAVDAAVASVAFNAGQVCSATCRVLLEASVHDQVVERIGKAVSHLSPGVDFGPMITEAQYVRVLKTLSEARDSGLVPLTGGAVYEDGPGADGWYVRPTVFSHVPADAPIARQEIFGPLLVTMPFADEEEAVALANDSNYGLVASVWTGSATQGLRLASRIQAGQVSVNGGPMTIETPFGGFKESGYGREKGIEALREYVQVKTVSLHLDN